MVSAQAQTQNLIPDGWSDGPPMTAERVKSPTTRQVLQQNMQAQSKTPVNLPAEPVIDMVYALNQGKPFWTGSAANNERVQQMLQYMNRLPRHGLFIGDYNFKSLAARTRDASFEKDFTQEIIGVLRDVSIGRLDPRTISVDVKYARRTFTAAQQIFDFVMSPSDRTFDLLAPQHQQYKDLMQTLAILKQVNAQGGYQGLQPVDEVLTLGVSHPVIAEMKQRLNVLGFNLGRSTTFDENFREAVETIQVTNLAKNTGEINKTSKAVWAYFAETSQARQLQVEIMMEKLRWLPASLGARHIIVNLATQQVSVIDPDLDSSSPVRLQKSIIGKIDRKTPSMVDRVSHVVLNPKWNVPPGIFARDKIPALRAAFAQGGIDGVKAYLEKNKFHLVNPRERTLIIEPELIEWETLTPDTASFMIQQDSGLDGSLGVVKIMLGNPYNIYIHDTNQRSLFEKFKRIFSSGCIRIEKPYDFAAYLLEGSDWNYDRIVSEVEGAETGKEQWVRLAPKKKMPVYIMPFTVSKLNGKVLFSPDSYGQDRAVFNALKRAGFYSQPSGVDALN